MLRGDWEQPVEIEIDLDRAGVYKTIPDTDTAARALVFDWPVEEGKALTAAKVACFSVLSGKADPDTARDAFIAAAAEADLSIRKAVRYMGGVRRRA